MAATAQQIRERERPTFDIDLGDGLVVEATLPDMQMLVLKGQLPTPLLAEVVRLVGAWVGTDNIELTEEVIAGSENLLLFVDTIVCASVVMPRIAMTEAERRGDDGVLLVSDFRLATRKKIFVEVTTRMPAPAVVADAKTFPTVGPGDGGRPDVPEVQAAAV